MLEAVAAAPPPSFSGGGFWEAMHSPMTDYHEVRVRGDVPGGAKGAGRSIPCNETAADRRSSEVARTYSLCAGKVGMMVEKHAKALKILADHDAASE